MELRRGRDDREILGLGAGTIIQKTIRMYTKQTFNSIARASSTEIASSGWEEVKAGTFIWKAFQRT
jgi:hypothetical protein